MSDKSKRVTCQAGSIGNVVNLFGHAEGMRYSTGSWERCRRIATHRFSSGCVHEHLKTWVVCARCAETLERQVREKPGAPRCIPCKQADGHICPVVAGAQEGLGPEAALRSHVFLPAAKGVPA